MNFQYDQSNQLHGFLRSLFDLGEYEYKKNLKYWSSSYFIDADRYLKPDHAFNFSSTNDNLYWLGDFNNDDHPTLAFCLPNHLASLSGFELATYTGAFKPKSFSLSSSLDNRTYTNTQTYNPDYSTDQIQYFSYSGSIARCFQLTCISGANNYNAFDVDHIEIYGVFQYYREKPNVQICRTPAMHSIKFIVSFLILKN